MPLWAVVVLIVLAVLAVAAGVALWVRDRGEDRRVAAALRRVPVQRGIDPALQDRRLTPPPMVGDLTLRDWLVHFSTERDRVWPAVVATFYRRAANVPEIADYFRETDMVRLQQHFARALTMVTGTGLTEATVRRLQQAHFGVHDSAGRPITPEIYDAVIGTLVEVLREQRVPASAIGQLADTIAPLRAVIVRPAEAAA
jgi:truncated hemoglobin YjbI